MVTWLLIFDHVAGFLGLAFAVAVLLSHYRHLDELATGTDAGTEGAGPLRSVVLGLMALAAAFAAIILAFAFRRHGFFSSGQHVAWGVCAGAVAGLVAALLCCLLSEAISVRERLASVHNPALQLAAASRLSVATALAMLSPAVLATAILLASFPDSPQDALIGMAMGGALVAIVVAFGLSILAHSAQGEHARALGAAVRGLQPLEAFCVFIVAQGVATFLASQHSFGDSGMPSLALWAVPTSIGGLGILAGLVVQPFVSVGSVARRPGVGATVGALATAVLIAGATALFARKLEHPSPLRLVALCGAVTGLLLLLLTGSAGERAAAPLARTRNTVVGAGLVLLTLAVCFKLLSGFGVGVALVAGLVTVMVAAVGYGAIGEIAEPTSPLAVARRLGVAASDSAGCLCVGVGYGIYRVFLERYPDAERMDVSTHYVFLGLLAGIVLVMLAATSNPIAAESLRRRRAGHSVGQSGLSWLGWSCIAARIGFTGLLAAGLCVALLALWGHKAALGIICSVPVAVLFVQALSASCADRQGEDTPQQWLSGAVPLLLAVGLFIAQVTGPWDVVMGLTIRQKLHVVFAMLVVTLLWVVVDAIVLARPAPEGEEGAK